MRTSIAFLLALAGIVFGFAELGGYRVAEAATTCVFTTSGKTMTLNGNCTTDASIIVPNGMTLNGAGYTITAVDPPGDHFRGGIIRNGGTSADVTNLKLNTSALANACDAGNDRLRGILFDGAGGSITNNTVQNINQGASGCQEGNGIEVRNFSTPNVFKVKITGNSVTNYQKTGIVANGAVSADISNNVVTGAGPVGYIAQNGIQVGFGADGSVKRNTVAGNSYTGSSAVSGGVLIVGGDCYAGALTVGAQIDNNTLLGNDVGVYLSNLDATCNAPAVQTNIKVIGNTISNNAVTNGYVYQAGVSDQGNNDKIINNTISGAGYTCPVVCFTVDADVSFTNKPKVHANK